MKKLTKNFIRKEMKNHMFNSERIVDIEIYGDGMKARVITITEYHTPEIYILHFNGTELTFYFAIMDFDIKETFKNPLTIVQL